MPLRRDHRHIAQYGGHGGGAAAPAFAPSDISGLVGWYKADTGILDASDVAITVDGTAMKTWQDQSGAAAHLIQATGANQPAWKDNIQNSQDVIRFDGTADHMRTAAFTSIPQPFTVFLALKWPVYASGTQTIFDGRLGNDIRWFRDSATTSGLYAGSVLAATHVQAAFETFHIWSIKFNGASSDLWMSGTQITATGNAGAQGTTGFAVGAFGDGASQFVAADIGEVIIYNASLNATNHNLVGNYLATKFGKTWTTVT